MFTDDIRKYRKNSDRVRLSSEIGAYRKPAYGLTRCTDDIASFQGKSLSPFFWVSMFAVSLGVPGLVALFFFFAPSPH